MDFKKFKMVLGDVYDTVHLVLWSVFIAGLCIFAVRAVPEMPRLRAEYEARRVLSINAEHDHYCRKWGMAAGSEQYRACMMDLQEFRTSVIQRLADETSF